MVYKINWFIFAVPPVETAASIPKKDHKKQNEMEALHTPSATEKKRRRFAREFARQLIVWAVTCSFLAVVNWMTSPHYWWVLWVIAGWGLQLILSLAFYLFDDEEEEEEASRHN